MTTIVSCILLDLLKTCNIYFTKGPLYILFTMLESKEMPFVKNIMPRITVIIPAYNAESTIEQCARSVLNQTLDGLEIIFINDGSTDKTGVLLDSLVKNVEYARVIHQRHQGLYRTREHGLALATGVYVGWVDADDFIEPDMYEQMYLEAVRLESDLVICDYDFVPGKIPTKYKWFREYKGKVNTEFVERNSQVWNKIVKRELLEKLEIGSSFVSCLDEIYIKVLMEAQRPVTLQKKLYHYRVGLGTMSSSYKNLAHYHQYVVASEVLFSLMQGKRSNYWDEYFEYRIIYYIIVAMIVAAWGNNMEAYTTLQTKLVTEHPRWKKNLHIDQILRTNFGPLKAFVIKNIIPLHYKAAKLVCYLQMRAQGVKL